MKTFAARLLSALIAVSLVLPAFTTSAEARRGRNTALGVGVLLGVTGAALLANPSRGHARDYERRGGNWCDRLARRCNRGDDYSCDKFEDRC